MAPQAVAAHSRFSLSVPLRSVYLVLFTVALCMCLAGMTGLSSAGPRPDGGADAAMTPAELPNGLDALDIVKQVQANRAKLAGQAEPGSILPVDAGEVGPPFRIDGDTVMTPAPGNQNSCAVAFGGRYYLLVWQNSLTGNAIHAARVDSSGLLLDPLGIVISPVAPGATFQEDPDVAFDGDNFLVVWQNYTDAYDRSIYGSRVDTSGVVLDGTGFVISDDVFDQYRPSVAFDGTNYFVVWDDFRNMTDTNIYGARVSTGGDVLDPDGIIICSASGSQTSPDVVFDGTRYFVVWSDYRGSNQDIYGGRVLPDGTVLDGSGGKAISTANYNQQLPKAAFDGEKYFVVWQDYRAGNYSYGDIYGARVDTTASVLGADAGGTAVSTTGNNLRCPDLIFDGTNFLVVWENSFSVYPVYYGEIYCARVDTTARVLAPGRVPVSIGTSWSRWTPCIAFDGEKSLVLWSDTRVDYQGYETDVFGAKVLKDASVAPPGEMLVAQGTNMAVYASVAFGGNGYMVVWQDKRSGSSYDIYGTRLDLSGGVLDPAGIPISTAVAEQSRPKVAYGLGKYFVVWRDDRAEDGGNQIYGARLDTLGIARDPDGIGIFTMTGTYCSYPSVAFNGQNFLVVWDDYRNTTDSDVYGARVDTAGTVLDPNGFGICVRTNNQFEAVVGSSGANCLVTWVDETADDGDVYANRVLPDGTVLDGTGIAVGVASSEQVAQSVAFDGTNYLVVWSDYRSGNDMDIYGNRVTTGGSVLDGNGFLISGAVDRQVSPAVAFDGTTYLVVWEDTRSGYEYQDIYGARVYPSGVVIDTAGFAISTAYDMQECPALAHGPGRAVLIAYDSYLAHPYGSMRIMGNFWPGPTPVTFLACRAEVSGGAVTLSWQVAFDVPASSFLVERAGSARGDYAALDMEVTRTGTWFSCVDSDVLPGATYWYKVSLVGVNSKETYGPVEVRVEQVPAAYALHQSYPNPFNPTCFIRFDTPRAGKVMLRVYDVGGRVVRTVADRWMESGSHTEVWDGRDDRGVAMPSGVYFYELATPDFRSTRKTVMLR